MERATRFVRVRAGELGSRMVLLRDLHGRISIVVDAKRSDAHTVIARELDASLGAYSPGLDDVLVFRGELFGLDAILGAEDAVPLFEDGDDIKLLEREIIGQDWLRAPLHEETPEAPPRAVFFGIKGGVGRSAALAVMAWRLAQADKRVLVLDLDLESPGLSSTLLPAGRMPDYGVVDWLVEDAVGQADEDLLRDMVESSPLVQATAGEILVVPSGGKKGAYFPKLSRAYMGSGAPERSLEFAQRLEAMVGALEAFKRPDVVLIDSRAGLHDDAAAAVTRLGATAFLFAVNTAQTWHAYDTLFEHWRRHPALHQLRQSLQLVSAMIPSEGRDRYESDFLERSYRLFQQNLYDEAPPDGGAAFSFDMTEETAPHSPLQAYWNPSLQSFDPVHRPGATPSDQIDLAYGAFVRRATKLLGLGAKP